MSSAMSVSRGAKMALATAKNPLTRTPVSSDQMSASEHGRADDGRDAAGSRRPSHRKTVRKSRRTPRATTRMSTASSAVRPTMTGQTVGEAGSMP